MNTLNAQSERSEPPTPAESWLTLVDAGQSAESWLAAGAVLRDAISAERWKEDVERVQRNLGPLTSRTIVVEQRLDALPSMPSGEFGVRQYHGNYADISALVEMLTLQRESDCVWRVVGNFVR